MDTNFFAPDNTYALDALNVCQALTIVTCIGFGYLKSKASFQ